MSIRRIIKTYDVSRTILRDRIEGCIPKTEERNIQHNLIPTKEETFVRYILDLNSRESPSRINDVRDMTDLFYKIRNVKLVNK